MRSMMHHARRWIGVGVVAALPACYTYVPVSTSPPALGETVALEITDEGRVSLRERLGPGVTRIEGRLVGAESDQYLINVFRIGQINGETSLWSGETMRLDRQFVGGLQERRLSKGRTWTAVVVATAVVAAFIASRGLNGIFAGDEDPPDPPDPPDTRIMRLRTGLSRQ